MNVEVTDKGAEWMPTLVRRFVLLLTLLFWQGGFMFYGAVVVPVGSEVLGSHRTQGWITRTVSNYLNLAGLAAVVVWCWEIASASDPVPRRRCLRWGLWTFLLLTLAGQFWLHMRLDEFLDIDSFHVLDGPRFHVLHCWYLNISTLQWAVSLILAAVTLIAWRACDRTVPVP